MATKKRKFSIVFPTRERVDLLDALLRSIMDTTDDHQAVEILVAYDDDDQATIDYVKNCKMNVIWVEGKQSRNFSRDYYSKLAKMATGDWIIVCNDDALFQTRSWDTIAAPVIEKFIEEEGKNVFMGWIEDGLGDARAKHLANYCCFPMFGKEGIDALGYIFPETVPTWGADVWAAKLYGIIGRCLTIPIKILHVSPHNNLRPVDHVQQKIRDEYVPQDLDPTRDQIVTLKKFLRS